MLEVYGEESFASFNQFSKLSLYGYSVSKNNGLTTKQRQILLKHIVDEHLLTHRAIISHLNGLIALREGNTKKDFSHAIKCWKEDIIFLDRYKPSKNHTTLVNTYR